MLILPQEYKRSLNNNGTQTGMKQQEFHIKTNNNPWVILDFRKMLYICTRKTEDGSSTITIGSLKESRACILEG